MTHSVENLKAAHQVARLPLVRQPTSVYIEVTKNCNELCTMCPRTHHWPDRRDNLSLESFRQIVDSIDNLQRVVLHGLGEPLLNPQLFEMVRYLKERGVYVLFNSNALALTEKRRQALLASGLDEYRISFDAARPETYHKIRGVNGLPRVKRNILALTALQREQVSPKPKLSLWFTTMRDNIQELPAVAQFAAEAGITELYIQRLVYFGEGLAVEEQSLYRKLNTQAEAALQETIAICQAKGVAVAASGGERLVGEQHLAANLDEEQPWMACTRPWRLMYIQANGDVSPCCFAPFTGKNGEPVLGNVFEQSVEQVWHGPKYREFREAFVSNTPPQCCEGCGARWSV